MSPPKPNAVSVALFEGAQVLLVRRARPPMKGLWTLPGGRLEEAESPEAAARRELLEELGLDVGPLLFVTDTVFDAGGAEFRLRVFGAAQRLGLIVPNVDEVADWRFVTPNSISELETTPGLLQAVARAHRIVAGI